MIAPMPEEFQERNDIAFIVTAAKYAPVECTWGFIRSHHAELSDDCLESLAGIFNGKAEMPDAKYYPLAEQGSWKYEETLRLIEEKENWLFMAKNIRELLKKRRKAGK